jgi:hypothetical protein
LLTVLSRDEGADLVLFRFPGVRSKRQPLRSGLLLERLAPFLIRTELERLKDGFGRSLRGHVLRYHLDRNSIAALALVMDDLLSIPPDDDVENLGVARGARLLLWTVTHDQCGGVVLDARALSELEGLGFPIERLAE